MKEEHQKVIEELSLIGGSLRTKDTLQRARKAIEELSKTVDDQQTTLRSITERFSEQESRALAERDHLLLEVEKLKQKCDALSAENETIRKGANNWREASIAYAVERDELLEKRDHLKSEVKNLAKARDHWRAEAERLRECSEAAAEKTAPRLRWMLEDHGTATGTKIKRKLQWFDGSEWRDVRIPPAPEAEQATTGIDIWIRTCGQMIEDRDAWRTMALALVEKLNHPTK